MTEFESVITRGMTPISEERRERAVLVGVDRPGSTWPLASSLAELERLVDTAGADAVATTTQKLDAPNPRTFVGTGKAEEVAELARAHAADLVVFDDELTPSQQANLEKAMGRDVKVIDRTALILDIFALHATSKEGRLQVRLAQNEYLLPRLRGMWAHLASNRMGGGVGSRFGEGESQLEVDRRMVRKRITSIKRELKHLAEVRAVQRESRYESGMFKVALAGYTNAGKSSLLNRLTNADVLAYDKLFATLAPPRASSSFPRAARSPSPTRSGSSRSFRPRSSRRSNRRSTKSRAPTSCCTWWMPRRTSTRRRSRPSRTCSGRYTRRTCRACSCSTSATCSARSASAPLKRAIRRLSSYRRRWGRA